MNKHLMKKKKQKKKTKKKKKKGKRKIRIRWGKIGREKQIETDQDNNIVDKFDDALKLNKEPNVEAGERQKVWMETTKLGHLRRNQFWTSSMTK